MKKELLITGIRTLTVTIILTLTLTQNGLAIIDYNDGGVYDINTIMPTDVVRVTNGTTINLQDGGTITSSRFAIFGYGIWSIGSFVNTYNGSSITGADGGINSGIYAVQNSVINIFGGNISGGSNGSSSASGIRVSDSMVNIYGGLITAGVGSTAPDIRIIDESCVVNIFGTDFNYAPGPVGDIEGVITGILSDGTPLDLTFYQDVGGQIVLIPEPASIAILTLGSLVLIRRKK